MTQSLLNYIATEPYVQVAFLLLIGVTIVVAFVNRRWKESEKNDFKREERRHEWAKEERSESKDLTVVKNSDMEGM